MFVAGTDTITSTVEWAMAELLQNEKAMSKAKQELEETIGRGKAVEESDIGRLPYLQAVIKETFRLHPAVPFLIPRKANADVEISGGYTIQKMHKCLSMCGLLEETQAYGKIMQTCFHRRGS